MIYEWPCSRVHQKGPVQSLTAPSKSRSPNRSSCVICLRFGCGLAAATNIPVCFMDAEKAISGLFFSRGGVGPSILKSQRVEAVYDLNLRPQAKKFVPAPGSLANLVRVGIAG